ncbi:hypothetical protein COB55_01960 [Candidatus Wolfebacteria bacterium]|nr:MAG: hypothetical protein COB55_01960 [Candidatus Wolfebacteria bacterium]
MLNLIKNFLKSSAVIRKEKSEKILKKKGIPINKNLPVITDDAEDVKIRSKKEIAQRAIALAIVAVKGEEVLKQDTLTELMDTFSARDFFTSEEKKFIENTNPPQQAKINFTWKYECYWVMLWVLGYIEKLDYPDHVGDVSKSAKILRDAGSYENLLKNSVLREPKEILDQADLIYRYHWACVNARLNEEDPPSELDSGVVVERHRALNWLVSYSDQDWDDVTTDT